MQHAYLIDVKTYVKSLNRLLLANKVRMAIIAGLTAISIAFIGGLGAVAPRMRLTRNYLLETMGENATDYDLQLLYEMDLLATRMSAMSFAFPGLFILVTVLVVFMTLTRMVETERTQIGCLLTMGYSKTHVQTKYLTFTGLATLAGCVVGVLVGHFVFYPIFFASAVQSFTLPNLPPTAPTFGLVAALITLAFTLLTTFFTVMKTMQSRPATLLRGRAPKVGGKVFLEHLPFLWRPLPFRYKSALRNIFRYRVRFFTTVASMVFSTALVFCGIAMSLSLEYTNAPELVETIRPISSIIVIFAVLLNAMVIYNITNINIDERKREIATLKVLGYKNTEVCGYIFREIFMLTIIGVVIGLPVGYTLIGFMFDFIGFGNIEFVNWYVWLLTGILALSSLALANLLLFRKVHKINMNSSLKTVDS